MDRGVKCDQHSAMLSTSHVWSKTALLTGKLLLLGIRVESTKRLPNNLSLPIKSHTLLAQQSLLLTRKLPIFAPAAAKATKHPTGRQHTMARHSRRERVISHRATYRSGTTSCRRVVILLLLWIQPDCRVGESLVCGVSASRDLREESQDVFAEGFRVGVGVDEFAGFDERLLVFCF